MNVLVCVVAVLSLSLLFLNSITGLKQRTEQQKTISKDSLSYRKLDKIAQHLPEPEDSATGGKLWVVLVSGDGLGWKGMSYATESDICRAYHIVKNHGVPDERIIVFM